MLGISSDLLTYDSYPHTSLTLTLVLHLLLGATVSNQNQWGWGLTFPQVALITGLVPFVLVTPWLFTLREKYHHHVTLATGTFRVYVHLIASYMSVLLQYVVNELSIKYTIVPSMPASHEHLPVIIIVIVLAHFLQCYRSPR